jgi:prepilin-type processing-associated H-X9-DG protein
MVPNAEGGAQGYLPSSTHGSEPGLWRCYWVLSNELAHPRVLVCPADDVRVKAPSWPAMEDTRIFFGRNATVSYGVGTGASPSMPRMILAADRSIEWTSSVVPYLFNGNTSTRSTIGTDATRIASMEWNPARMHPAAGNVLFADGSVGRLNSAGLRHAWLNSGDTRNAYSQPGRSAN